jgi:hypothetical protein
VGGKRKFGLQASVEAEILTILPPEQVSSIVKKSPIDLQRHQPSPAMPAPHVYFTWSAISPEHLEPTIYKGLTFSLSMEKRPNKLPLHSFHTLGANNH